MAERDTTAEDLISQYSIERETETHDGWLDWLPSWKPTSHEILRQCESKILNNLTSPYVNLFVPVSDEATVRTITISPDVSESNSPPLVMVHGFGAGLACFFKNFDSLHARQRLFAFDVLGFARSSRVDFATDPESVEEEFVQSIEKWRAALKLDRMILLGHSLGAFMSCAYAMRYPERIQHLILVEPWGFNRKPDVFEPNIPNVSTIRKYMFKIARSFSGHFNLFSPLRAAGPLGPYIVSKFRPDLEAKFGEDFMKYVYHCNAQNPTGESAFFYLQVPIAWARRPMLERLSALSPDIPISLMYGTRSWFDSSTGEKIFSARPDSYVDIHFVSGAGHHIHVELPQVFNEIVQSVCQLTVEERDKKREGEPRTQQDAFHTH